MAELLKAPEEPTNGDVMIAIETLRNAGAHISTNAGVLTIVLEVGANEEQTNKGDQK